MDRWKSRGGKSQRREEEKKQEDQRRERVRRKKMQVRESLCVFHVFPMFSGSRGSKSRLAKAAGAEPSGEMRDEQLHAVVTRSTFPSQNVWRKFRSQTSDNMDRWKAEMGRVREEKRRRKKIKKRKSQKKEDPNAPKGRKVAKHCVFPMLCGSGEAR